MPSARRLRPSRRACRGWMTQRLQLTRQQRLRQRSRAPRRGQGPAALPSAPRTGTCSGRGCGSGCRTCRPSSSRCMLRCRRSAQAGRQSRAAGRRVCSRQGPALQQQCSRRTHALDEELDAAQNSSMVETERDRLIRLVRGSCSSPSSPSFSACDDDGWTAECRTHDAACSRRSA